MIIKLTISLSLTINFFSEIRNSWFLVDNGPLLLFICSRFSKKLVRCFKKTPLQNRAFKQPIMTLWGASRAFSGREIRHFLGRDIGIVGFKIAKKGMRYTYGTRNFIDFLFGKREKYETIVWMSRQIILLSSDKTQMRFLHGKLGSNTPR